MCWDFRVRLLTQALGVLNDQSANVQELDDLIVLGAAEELPDDEPMLARDLREATLTSTRTTEDPDHADMVAWPRLTATLVVVAYVAIAELEVEGGEAWPAEVRELLTRATHTLTSQQLDLIQKVNDGPARGAA